MQSQPMTATEFKAELRRLKLSQTEFAERSNTPLRTVQSWANGERAIPTATTAVIEKVGAIESIKVMLETKSMKSLEALFGLLQSFGKETTKLRQVEALCRETEAELKKLRSEFDALKETCVFQAKKITAYVKDDERRAAQAVTFNT